MKKQWLLTAMALVAAGAIAGCVGPETGKTTNTSDTKARKHPQKMEQKPVKARNFPVRSP